MSKWTLTLPVLRPIRLIVVLLLVSLCFLLIQFHSVWLIPLIKNYQVPSVVHTDTADRCPDHLLGVAHGGWIQRNVNYAILKELNVFMREIRRQYYLPRNMQRKDGKCGNVSFATDLWNVDNTLKYFRGTCDPDGLTPCCREGTCISWSLHNCVCPECFDLRRDIHAELATWKPDDSRCGLQEFKADDACHVLSGATVLIAGDSIMRQLYVAMLITLTGNHQDGALGNNITQEMRQKCSGMFQFTDKECRQYIMKERRVCAGRVKIIFKACPRAAYIKQFLSAVKSLAHQSRALVLISLGQHDGFSVPLVKFKFLHPLLTYMKSSKLKWPRLLWVSIHAFGTLSFAQGRRESVVKNYNKEIGKMLKNWNTPVIDTYRLTKGLASPDGVHFGEGVNLAKVKLILTYLYGQRLNHYW